MSYSEQRITVVQFLNRLEPIFEVDRGAWQKQKGILGCSSMLVWQASSGLDCTVMWELNQRSISGLHQAPQPIRARMTRTPLFLFSDYSMRVLSSLKHLYAHVETVDPMEVGWKAFHPCSKGGGILALLQKNEVELPCSVNIRRIIPLRLFANSERLRGEYPNFSAAVTAASVPDEDWHCSFAQLELTLHRQTMRRSVLLFHLDNLVVFEEIMVKHRLPIDILYAKRVGRGSGSWSVIHSETGALLSSIRRSPYPIRPKFWAADVAEFTSLGHQVFGFASWYQPPWRHSGNVWHWIEQGGRVLE